MRSSARAKARANAGRRPAWAKAKGRLGVETTVCPPATLTR
jgi:hypothetical protein